MEDHRGKISFESEKGKGTKVNLSFPLETPSQTPQCVEQTAFG
jgi:signal transduction histidine kinase